MNQSSPSPPNADVERRKKRGGKSKRSCDGNLKLAIRFHEHRLSRPWTVYSDKRFDRNFDRALFQLTNMVGVKFKGKVAWAEIYDVGPGTYGPCMATFKQGEWHYHANCPAR